MIVGVDIGGHHVAAAAIAQDAPGALVADTFQHVACAPSDNRATLIAAWAGAIDAVVERVGPDQVRGIGIAMPGSFDYTAGIAYFEGNGKFAALYGVDVAQALAETLRHPRPVRFLNDATAFAVGCVAIGATPARGNVVGVTLGTGLGSAFLRDGIPAIDGDDVPPHGSLWHLPFREGIADDHVSARWLTARIAQRLDGIDTVVAAADAARAGNETAATIFADYGDNLGTILSPWVDRFGAGTVMLGGRICGAFDLFGPVLRQHLPTTHIAVHADTEDAAIIGAARTFDATFWDRARHHLPTR
ncbi:ROK family protein [uncultured Sphingomonas sp.]|uniref:ROK family protein n=1 Tax=uncultured Sphingomonas sp. TaxID=158754 RepID=UPI0025D52E30|nr:ROK family protein [uncultured Sphingomonas sp.]